MCVFSIGSNNGTASKDIESTRQFTDAILDMCSTFCIAGYFPLQPEEVSYKEGFEVGQDNPPATTKDTNDTHPFFTEPNVWPDGMEGSERFHEEMVQHYRYIMAEVTGKEMARPALQIVTDKGTAKHCRCIYLLVKKWSSTTQHR